MTFRSSAIVAAAAMLLTSIVPVHAAPLKISGPAPATSAPASNLVDQVQYYRDDWRRGPPPGYRRPPPPPGWRAGPPPPRHGYYNGHRGYRDRRPGYRQHNGYWFPLAAFATGAIIGGAINNQAAPAYGGSHHEWCANRWRSYRAYDNSYQPNNGPRRECVSPYMR